MANDESAFRRQKFKQKFKHKFVKVSHNHFISGINCPKHGQNVDYDDPVVLMPDKYLRLLQFLTRFKMILFGYLQVVRNISYSLLDKHQFYPQSDNTTLGDYTTLINDNSLINVIQCSMSILYSFFFFILFYSSETFEQTTVLMTNNAISNTFTLTIDNIATVVINDAFDVLNELYLYRISNSYDDTNINKDHNNYGLSAFP